MEKQYLGDGAYFAYDGHNVVLTAENGICATDTVCLEPEVLDKLFLCLLKLPKGHSTGDRLRDLVDRDNKLAHLEMGGVDNWEWYSESLRDYWDEED